MRLWCMRSAACVLTGCAIIYAIVTILTLLK